MLCWEEAFCQSSGLELIGREYDISGENRPDLIVWR
jgi:hypothetical protein